MEFGGVEQPVDVHDLSADLLAGIKGRKDLHENDLRLRAAEAEVLDAELDAVDGGGDGDTVGLHERGVVHTDHEHDHFGRCAIERAVIESPEDVLHAISADAEVHSFLVVEVFLPRSIEGCAIPATAPALRDAVADKRDVDAACGLHLLDACGVMLEPVVPGAAVLRSPMARSGCDEPHVRLMLLRFMPRLAEVFALRDPINFGLGQRPTGELRVEFAVVVGRIGIEERFAIGRLWSGLEHRCARRRV